MGPKQSPQSDSACLSAEEVVAAWSSDCFSRNQPFSVTGGEKTATNRLCLQGWNNDYKSLLYHMLHYLGSVWKLNSQSTVSASSMSGRAANSEGRQTCVLLSGHTSCETTDKPLDLSEPYVLNRKLRLIATPPTKKSLWGLNEIIYVMKSTLSYEWHFDNHTFQSEDLKERSQTFEVERVLPPLVHPFNSSLVPLYSCKNGKIWLCQPSCTSCCCTLLILATACCFMPLCLCSCSSISLECSLPLHSTWQMSTKPSRHIRAKDRLFSPACSTLHLE